MATGTIKLITISKIENIDDSIHQLNIPEYEKSDKYIPTFNLMIRIAKLIRSARCKTTTHTSLKTPIYSCNIYMNDTTELVVPKSIPIIFAIIGHACPIYGKSYFEM